mgnify:CR=1 FL=1
MRDKSCFRDWETVILKTPSPILYGKPHSNGGNSCENDIEKPKKVSNELKKTIQQARVNNKLSQKQLASMMCCQPSVINQYENGKAIPNNEFICKMEQKLKTKLPRIKKNHEMK